MFNFPIYIQYDDTRMTDGFGAQGLRVLGTMAIAHFFKLKYVHQNISEISNRYELIGSQTEHSRYENIMKELNSYLEPRSVKHKHPPARVEVIKIYNLGFRTLGKYIFLSLFKPNRYLLKVCLPFGITDRFPRIYLSLRGEISHDRGSRDAVKGHRKVVVHIRTGEHSPAYPRHQLGPDYYSKLILSGKYGNLKNDQWIVHTDFKFEDFGQDSKSERVKSFRNLFEDIGRYESVEIFHYANIEEVFDDMVHAQILIVSRSALSYLAAILCEGEVVFPSNHGHSALPHWIVENS